MDICETSLNWGRVSNRFGGGVIVMSLIAKIKQTMHKLGISLICLDRVNSNQNGGFLSFGVK